MADIADTAVGRRASVKDGADESVSAEVTSPGGAVLAPLASVAANRWRALSERAVEPNGYYLPGWALAVDAFARGRTGASALAAWREGSSAHRGSQHLIGLLPAISMWRGYKVPLPALVSAEPYGTLSTPLLDRGGADDAAARLLEEARKAGAHALILRNVTLDGAAMKAFTEALRRDGMRPQVLRSHCRACLDATRDSEELLRDALGAKKLKELRRQRKRLSDHGEVRFHTARSQSEVAAAIEVFLQLEASGWKGRRGTALGQHEGDTRFVRRATSALAETGQCEIVTLRAGDMPVAAAIVLRHQDRAFYFKLGFDERFAKCSPGVQLTLDLTRHLCADPAIATADSTATADHSMIDPIWRDRLAIGDVLIPLRPGDPIVPLIRIAMGARYYLLAFARTGIRFVRARLHQR